MARTTLGEMRVDFGGDACETVKVEMVAAQGNGDVTDAVIALRGKGLLNEPFAIQMGWEHEQRFMALNAEEADILFSALKTCQDMVCRAPDQCTCEIGRLAERLQLVIDG